MTRNTVQVKKPLKGAPAFSVNNINLLYAAKKMTSAPFRFTNQRSLPSETRVRRDSDLCGLDKVACMVFSGRAVCETDACSVFIANLPSGLHSPPLSCVHTSIALLNGFEGVELLWMTLAIVECLQLCKSGCQGSVTHADCEKQTEHPQSGFELNKGQKMWKNWQRKHVACLFIYWMKSTFMLIQVWMCFGK